MPRGSLGHGERLLLRVRPIPDSQTHSHRNGWPPLSAAEWLAVAVRNERRSGIDGRRQRSPITAPGGSTRAETHTLVTWLRQPGYRGRARRRLSSARPALVETLVQRHRGRSTPRSGSDIDVYAFAAHRKRRPHRKRRRIPLPSSGGTISRPPPLSESARWLARSDTPSIPNRLRPTSP